MTFEETALLHSKRGMDILKKHLRDDFITDAAKKIYSLERKNILLATGFYVAGYAETDGPPGTYFLSLALKEAGFEPVIVTDGFCRDFFPEDKVNTEYVEKGFDPEALLEKYKPCCLISIERCGENINGDYANMRGVSIARHTADIDRLFDLARAKGIYTVGIGDGGNEIGMGNLKEVISEELSLVPCKTQTTDLIIATVSNWGAYALAGAVSVLQGKNLFKEYKEVDGYIKYIVGKGSVDGVNKVHEPTVDGFSPETEKEIVDKINNLTNELISK